MRGDACSTLAFGYATISVLVAGLSVVACPPASPPRPALAAQRGVDMCTGPFWPPLPASSRAAKQAHKETSLHLASLHLAAGKLRTAKQAFMAQGLGGVCQGGAPRPIWTCAACSG